jgi:hypothetical protein
MQLLRISLIGDLGYWGYSQAALLQLQIKLNCKVNQIDLLSKSN